MKWEKSGLLEGLNDKFNEKATMAVLLQNQAKQLVTEANNTGTVAGAEEWAGVALPLIRRIFGEIAAKEFVSVQPMTLPSGLVFYLDFKHATSQAGFNTNSGRTSQADSVFGITDARRGGTAGTEGLYGAGRFGYSINNYSASVTPSGNGTYSASTFGTASLSLANNAGLAAINYNSEFSASAAAAGSSLALVYVTASSLTNPDLKGVRAFTISGTGIADVYQEFTTVNSNGLITFVVTGSGYFATASSLTINYMRQPTDITRGDFEDGNTQSGPFGTPMTIPKMDLQMRSEDIVAKTRRLKAEWTPEFAQDLNAYHSIDAEAELTSMLSEYISMEIDLEILDMLIQEAQTVDYWSVTIGDTYNGSSWQNTGATSYYNQQSWFQTLGTKIQKVSNTIHKLTMRGGANFLVTSPTVATVLESIPGYAVDTDGNQAQFAMGVQKVGMVNNRFTVYKNPYMTENIILMGYRGSQFLETGAVYAPYIPLIMTPLVLDPDNFTPRKGVQTRYAKKVVRPEFYGKIKIKDLSAL